MQITAPTHHVAVSPSQTGKRTATRLRGHRQRVSFQLPWQVNAAIATLIGFGVATCVLSQL